MSPPDSDYGHNLVCAECYSAIEQENARKREEYWREEEEKKLE
jgi:post-segregation antitoxin (ccd killing protein)